MGIRRLPAFPVVREFLRAKVRGRRRHGLLGTFMWRLMMAGLATVATIGLASLGEFFSTAPGWVSLTFGPLSLLLTPGFVVAMFTSGLHDLDPSIIVQASILFYLVFYFGLLTWRARPKTR